MCSCKSSAKNLQKFCRFFCNFFAANFLQFFCKIFVNWFGIRTKGTHFRVTSRRGCWMIDSWPLVLFFFWKKIFSHFLQKICKKIAKKCNFFAIFCKIFVNWFGIRTIGTHFRVTSRRGCWMIDRWRLSYLKFQGIYMFFFGSFWFWITSYYIFGSLVRLSF